MRALPPRLQEALENGFRIESDCWGVGSTGAYQGDYYSHWLDLDAEPTNAIHQAVQHIAERTLSAEERAQVSGVEWWAHRRPYLKHSASEADFNRTRYLAHHLRKRPRKSLPAFIEFAKVLGVRTSCVALPSEFDKRLLAQTTTRTM